MYQHDSVKGVPTEDPDLILRTTMLDTSRISVHHSFLFALSCKCFNFDFFLVVQTLLILGHQHQSYRHLMEVVRLQHEEIAAKGKEVKSLNRRVTEVEDLLARRDADVEKKDAELESRAGELERVKTLNG